MENLNRPTREHNDFDLKLFLRKYFRYWYIFVIVFFLSMVFARYYNWYTSPIYGVTAKLLVKDDNNGKDKLLQQLNVEKPTKNIENEIEILRSHSLLAKVLNELDFEVSYFLVGDVKTSEVYTDCPVEIIVNNIEYSAYFKNFSLDLIDAGTYQFSYQKGEVLETFTSSFGDTP